MIAGLAPPIPVGFAGLGVEAGLWLMKQYQSRIWLGRWQGKYAKLTDWVEDAIEETFTFYRLPLAHHKHLKSTNMLERYNQEIKRRTQVVRIFPNGESCLRLIRALAVETHEDWLEANRYINMKLLKEHKRELMKHAA